MHCRYDFLTNGVPPPLQADKTLVTKAVCAHAGIDMHMHMHMHIRRPKPTRPS